MTEQVQQLITMSLKQPVRLAADAAGRAPEELRQEIVRLKVCTVLTSLAALQSYYSYSCSAGLISKVSHNYDQQLCFRISCNSSSIGGLLANSANPCPSVIGSLLAECCLSDLHDTWQLTALSQSSSVEAQMPNCGSASIAACQAQAQPNTCTASPTCVSIAVSTRVLSDGSVDAKIHLAYVGQPHRE